MKYISVSFSICCFLFILILLTNYFTRKRINNIGTKIYSYLIIVNVSLLIIDIGGFYFFGLDITANLTKELISKFYLVFFTLFGYIFSYYSTIIIVKEKRIVKLCQIVLCLFFVITSILCLILPIEIVNEHELAQPVGLGVFCAYLYALLLVIYLVIIIFINIKDVITLKDKKIIPIFSLIFFSAVAVFIQYKHPGVALLLTVDTLVTFIMYFTIENPDLQMLREFHKQRELANESNQEKTSFLFNMSNQIKDPLLVISNVCGEALLENNVDDVKEDLRRIKSSSNELLQLVNNVLDISDIEKRKIGIRENKYNVYNLFEVLNKNFSKNINKQIEYRFHFDRSIPEYLYGDSIRIKQVMNILLDNALEYTKEGFIEVNINSIMKYDICRLIITVEDSGQGMSADQIKNLFDKEKIYSNEELKEIDDNKNNLGILKSIVNLMNGSVLVNSDIGKGSRFTIVIDQKVKVEKTKIIETVEKYEEMYENKEKILLVINHIELSKKINKMLKKSPYVIEEVKGGQSCLEKIRKNEKFDLIIMEEDLEKLSSEDTLTKLKDTSGYKIPVILISNNRGFRVKETYQEKGFKDVLFLPLKKEEVLKQVKEYIKD